jgi:hypothetical protein
VLAKVKDLADFAAAEFFDAGKIAGKKIHSGGRLNLKAES